MIEQRGWTEQEWTEQQRRWTAIHETGHAGAAFMLGRPITLVSIRPTAHYQGVATHTPARWTITDRFRPELPAILQPTGLRRPIETSICIYLAGDMAQQAYRPPASGFVAKTADEAEAEAAARSLVGLTGRARAHLEELERPPEEPLAYDDERARELSHTLAGDEAFAHLEYMRAVTRNIVGSWTFGRLVDALVPVLLERRVIPGRQVRRIFQEALGQRRPVVHDEIAASID